MQPQFIIVCGNPADGFSFVGPFDSHDDASAYGAVVCAENWWITMLDAPAE